MSGPSLRSRKRARINDRRDEQSDADAAASASTTNGSSAPPSAAVTGKDVYALADGELMHSTSKSSAGKRAWLRLLPCLQRQQGYTYVSCDGSSSGWHACVVAVGDLLHLRARWADMQASRRRAAVVEHEEHSDWRLTRRERGTWALRRARMLWVSRRCWRCTTRAATR
jgi:hypothetical protein